MNHPPRHLPLNPDRIVDPRSQPKAEPRFRGDLPHIHKEGCTYFVTFCLADAVPDRIKRRRQIDGVENPQKVADHFDVDPSTGGRILKRLGVGAIVESSLLHFQGERYALSAWCVMPNHVHAVVTPYSEFTFSQILHSWKSYSAHQINKALRRKGIVWEQESFDHLIRNEHAFASFVEYTENNPVAAKLCPHADDWPFCSARYRKSAE